jgi:RHS repeat-associated protein
LAEFGSDFDQWNDINAVEEYEYDAAGRMTSVTAPDGKQARYGYDSAGRLMTTERDLNPVNGQSQVLVTYQRYDAADRMIAIAHTKRIGSSETLVAGQAITRGAGGTISEIDTYRAGSYDAATGQFTGTPATTQAFEYDGNARLTRENRTVDGNNIDTHYEYDAAGNRTKKTVSTAAGTDITSYTYDAADRLTAENTSLAAGGTNTINYTWDGNGNLASKTEAGKVTLYRFDPQNRLIDIRTGATLAQAQSASPSVTYAYDAAGNRVKKTTPQGITNYVIDNAFDYSQVALETGTSYVRGAQLVRQTKNGGTSADDSFPLQGHLGTSVGAVSADGNLIEQIDSDAFGKLDQPTARKLAHIYTGQYWDQDSQLLYLRARWYEPGIGRFVSADPIQGRQRNPRSLNRYTYASLDPVHTTDRSGLFSTGEIAESMEILGINSSMQAARVAGVQAVRSTILKRVAVGLAATGASYALLQWNKSDKDRDLPVIIFGGDVNEATKHYADAIDQNPRTGILARKYPPNPKGWAPLKPECSGQTGGNTGNDCDEYPFAAAEQGGSANYPGTVSLRPVNSQDNQAAGRKLGIFYGACDISTNAASDDKWYVVAADASAAVTTFKCDSRKFK